jgi:hypothetical protein
MTTCRILLGLTLAATATFACADDRIAAKAPGVDAEIRSDGSIRVQVEARDGEQWLSIHDSGQAGEIDCKGRHVSITAERSVLKLTGNCPFVDVSGDDNQVSVETLGEVSIAGDNNVVEWKRAASGTAPEISNSGDDNVIRRAAN